MLRSSAGTQESWLWVSQLVTGGVSRLGGACAQPMLGGELARRSPRHLPCGEAGEAGRGRCCCLSFFSSVIYLIGYRLTWLRSHAAQQTVESEEVRRSLASDRRKQTSASPRRPRAAERRRRGGGDGSGHGAFIRVPSLGAACGYGPNGSTLALAV